MSHPDVIPRKFDNYMAIIKNSIGTSMFKNLYADVYGKKKDVARNGKLSCAFFVSSILYLNHLIKDIHATVQNTIKDLEESGYKIIKKPKLGCIIIWESIFDKDGEHSHIGFYMGNNKAISNISSARTPKKHDFTFNNKRKVIAYYYKEII